MNYQESLNYIHSLLRFGIKPGLERVSAILAALGNPQDACRFIHIAGTNGKGSTSTMLAAMMRSTGQKTGLYTSPYVTCFRERIQINGEMIPESALCQLTVKVKSAAEEIGAQPTEFEFITALALLWFAQEKCDIVVLETGLGGRFDATNVITNPLVSVITPIGLDHTAILGDTIEKIAAEKGGIIKKGCPCVVAAGQTDSVKAVLAAKAKEMDAPIFFADEPQSVASGVSGTDFIYKGNLYHSDMMGAYQAQNGATAIEVALKLPDMLSSDDIKKGVANAFIPARMEKISLSPLTILDGGHNGHAAAALKGTIEQLSSKPVAIIGMMEDKDISDYAALLGSCFERIVTVEVADNPRSISASALAEIFSRYNKNVTTAEDYQSAINLAQVGKADVMVCGSLYLAGGIRPMLLDVFR